MPDFHGPIQHVTLAGTLWLLVIFPLAAALVCAWRALMGTRETDKTRDAIAIVSIGAMGLALAMSAYHAWVLASLPDDERFLLQHAWRMVREGQLDASFDLALDTLSSTMTLVVTGIGLPIFVFAASSMRPRADETTPSYARFFAWLNGFVFAMLVLVLADNFILLFFGWEGVGLCSWGLIGFAWTDGAKASAGKKAFLVNRIGDAGFVLGVALFYWGFGGAWADGDYVPDLNARFSSVEVRADDPEGANELAPKAAARDRDDEDEDRTPSLPSANGANADADGFLTLTSYPGAAVFMDDARTPLKIGVDQLLRSPFVRLPVKRGIHSFRIHPGGGLDDFLVTHVAFNGGREIALTSFGPTVTFREARDQLAARDLHGRATVRDALLSKRGFGAAGLVTIASLLLFVGAIGKSAQLPLHVWLPDAMAGPTPVSALIHAATMVTAGVYLVARLGFFFVLSPTACTVVATVGASTALFAAIAGLYQYDLKRVLAFSTVSQLGLMMIAVGVCGYASGVFHLVTHACFKACLFLSAGALIHAFHHALHDEKLAQDVRRMGGLGRVLPKTARAYAIGCLAITAAPIPGLAGFWSKDDILVRAFTAKNLVVPGPVFGGVALVVAALTSFYMWRTYYLAFEGEPRTPLRGVTEPTGAIPGALTVLAGLSVVAGIVLGVSPRLIGRGGESLLEEWLAPSLRGSEARFANGGALVEWAVIGAAYSCALGGFLLARARYASLGKSDDWESRERRSPIFAASTHAFGIDALYTHTIVALTLRARDFAAEFDRRVIDSVVNASGVLTRALSWVVGRADDHVVDGAVRALSEGTLRLGDRVRSAQTGRVQSYVYAIVLGILALAFLQYWLR